nr:hypothetical protein [Tanacetum cinerariifolium]
DQHKQIQLQIQQVGADDARQQHGQADQQNPGGEAQDVGGLEEEIKHGGDSCSVKAWPLPMPLLKLYQYPCQFYCACRS